MATIRLLKDRKVQIDGKEVTQKKDAVVSVPFLKGREMVAAGEAELVAQPAPVAKSAPVVADGTVSADILADVIRKRDHAAKLAAERIEYLEGENAKLAGDIKTLTAQLDEATKPKGDAKK